MALEKNTTGQLVLLRAYDAAGSNLDGDAANITATIRKDGGSATAIATNTATGLGNGEYSMPLSQAETNADHVLIQAVSATSGVTVDVIGGENGATSVMRAVQTALAELNTSGTVTAEDVDERYTFKFPRAGSGTNAGKRVPVNTGFAGDICFDVEGVIYKDATVASVSSVTVSDSGATVGSIRLHTGKRKFLVPLSAVSTTGTYEVAATFTTTDSQTIKVVGTLVVK